MVRRLAIAADHRAHPELLQLLGGVQHDRCAGLEHGVRDTHVAVLARCNPHDGFGLASACGSVMRCLADSSCIVDGQGVVAYRADCKVRWRSRTGCSCYDYDEQHDLLVTATWQSHQSVTLECVKNLGWRPFTA